MHDQDIPLPTPGERLNQLELLVLHLMTGDEQQVWSVEDLGRELDDAARVIDAVRELRTAGLIHQTSDGFVFATRAAVRLIEVVGKVA
ncbi:MAG TPA: hypothetical protein VMU32_09390 [Solirubrobacteraceae bacterium]|nr:hypothetical protein [Solirubrobacteraceae bacterium]